MDSGTRQRTAAGTVLRVDRSRLDLPLADLDPQLAAVAAAQGGAFTRRDAVRAGWREDDCDLALALGTWRSTYRGVYLDRHTLDTPTTRAAAAVLAGPPGTLAAEGLALRLLGLHLEAPLPDADVVTAPPGPGRHPVPGLVGRRLTLAPQDVTSRDGVPTTTGDRAVLDAGRRMGVRDAVVVADAALHQRVATPAGLGAAVLRLAGCPRVVHLREVVALADPGAESPGETRLRLHLQLDGGLPRPVTQYRVFDGVILMARADLAYPHERLLLEYDGWEEHRQRRASDRLRDRRLEGLGWTVRRYGSEDLRLGPDGAAADVRRLLAGVARAA